MRATKHTCTSVVRTQGTDTWPRARCTDRSERRRRFFAAPRAQPCPNRTRCLTIVVDSAVRMHCIVVARRRQVPASNPQRRERQRQKWEARRTRLRRMLRQCPLPRHPPPPLIRRLRQGCRSLRQNRRNRPIQETCLGCVED